MNDDQIVDAAIANGFVDPVTEAGITASTGKSASKGKNTEPTIPELLVEMATARYDVFLGLDGEPYAVERNGSSIALPLRGRTGLKQRLAVLLWESRGKVPSGQASADVLNVLEGKALDKPRRPVSLRVERAGDRLLIDMGTADGRVIDVGPDGWHVVTGGSPGLFRRTALTGAMPDPDPEGTLDAFQAGMNVSEVNFRLIIGWMLHAFIPDEPHPVLGLVGEQGTAKTTAAKHIAGIIDASPAPTRTAPKDLTDWAVTAAGSWVVTLDNISEIKPWFSDALCKAVTGDAMTKRALYTDGDLSVLSFLRPIVMTSIEAGALRGDLAERMLPVELERIPREKRRTEKSVRLDYEHHQGQTLGALLNLLSQVLKVLPDVQVTDLPRMADFTRFLAALDQVSGWTTRTDYEETFGDLADAVITGDPFATAIREKIDRLPAPGFDGTASELLTWAAPATDEPLASTPRGWPKTPHGASGALKRITPALLAAGISVDFYREGHKRTRKIRIWRAADAADAADAVSQLLYTQTEIGNKGQRSANRSAESLPETASAASAASATASDLPKRADAPADAAAYRADAPASAPAAGGTTSPQPGCCGQRADAGQPVVGACTLCPSSPTYWRKTP
ncbi:hypothetical protein [Micromonospora sp. DH14]|uniref:hypothetical protein n=1 Tax=Micromonospora sp. DH14 TaxID=3040120 RepID=UPI002442676D|nr:hypothetical protein [Micromonospora sp. DH14]MDG9673027.1 hypothetical protein [Micromonospora sp. DH14]